MDDDEVAFLSLGGGCRYLLFALVASRLFVGEGANSRGTETDRGGLLCCCCCPLFDLPVGLRERMVMGGAPCEVFWRRGAETTRS